MGNDGWAILGVMGVLVLPLVAAWWWLGFDDRRSHRNPGRKGHGERGDRGKIER